jgi:hypothetical protein
VTYEIRVDRANELIEVTLGEMMSLDEVSNYITELKRQIRFFELPSYALRIDVSQCPVQAQDMIGAMGQHMATMPKAPALAVVTRSALARMQCAACSLSPWPASLPRLRKDALGPCTEPSPQRRSCFSLSAGYAERMLSPPVGR